MDVQSLALSLVHVAPIVVNRNGSEWTKPGPKTSPSTDTAPPRGKYGWCPLNTIRKPVPKKDALTVAEKLRILDVMRKNRWTQPQTAENFNMFEGYKGQVTQYNISHWKGQDSNPKNTATAMETDGSAILVSDSEPDVLGGDYSHLQSPQEGLMMTM